MAWFDVCFFLFLALTIIEILSFCAGIGFDALDTLLPDIDIESGGRGEWLSWFYVGKVPAIILVQIFLVCMFGIGRGVDAFVSGPGWVQIFLSLGPALWLTRQGGKGVAKILPSEVTDAVPLKSLVGQVATITTGVATATEPAPARVRDHYKKIHYVLVEPLDPEQQFQEGESVLLLQMKNPTIFFAERNSYAALMREEEGKR